MMWRSLFGPDRIMTFHSIYRHGFARVAACSIQCTLADPAANAAAILQAARDGHGQAAALLVFPELCLSGYAIADLLLQDPLPAAVERAVAEVVARPADLMPLLLFGAPLRPQGRLYNTALAVQRGRLLGVVPKVHLPNYREFYEHRHFASGAGTQSEEIDIGGLTVPFSPDLPFVAQEIRGLLAHAEICIDFYVPVPPSGAPELHGS